jgi:hypothetical protein
MLSDNVIRRRITLVTVVTVGLLMLSDNLSDDDSYPTCRTRVIRRRLELRPTGTRGTCYAGNFLQCDPGCTRFERKERTPLRARLGGSRAHRCALARASSLPARDHHETQSTRWHTSPPLPPSRCAQRRAYAKIDRSKHQPRAAIGSGFAWRAAQEQRGSSASRLTARPRWLSRRSR